MQRKEIIEALWEKLDRNWNDYLNELDCLTKNQLIEKSDEITAACFVYNELYSGEYPDNYMEYLLRFENPLEVVRDQWILEQTGDVNDELSHTLWNLWDKGAAEKDYALDPKYQQPPPQEVTMC